MDRPAPGGPEVTAVRMIRLDPTTPRVALDRAADTPHPEYCVHGRTQCVDCGEWVLLGHTTHEQVLAGKLVPICLPCVRGPRYRQVKPTGNIRDHRRADGPHT